MRTFIQENCALCLKNSKPIPRMQINRTQQAPAIGHIFPLTISDLISRIAIQPDIAKMIDSKTPTKFRRFGYGGVCDLKVREERINQAAARFSSQ